MYFAFVIDSKKTHGLWFDDVIVAAKSSQKPYRPYTNEHDPTSEIRTRDKIVYSVSAVIVSDAHGTCVLFC